MGVPVEYGSDGDDVCHPQDPHKIYRGLDFSIRRYRRQFNDINPAGWEECADECNYDPKCRTFTAHEVYRYDPTFRTNRLVNVICYFHKDWKCNHGSECIKDSIDNPNVYSGVC